MAIQSGTLRFIEAHKSVYHARLLHYQLLVHFRPPTREIMTTVQNKTESAKGRTPLVESSIVAAYSTLKVCESRTKLNLRVQTLKPAFASRVSHEKLSLWSIE
jgi:hypothetical protein